MIGVFLNQWWYDPYIHWLSISSLHFKKNHCCSCKLVANYKYKCKWNNWCCSPQKHWHLVGAHERRLGKFISIKGRRLQAGTSRIETEMKKWFTCGLHFLTWRCPHALAEKVSGREKSEWGKSPCRKAPQQRTGRRRKMETCSTKPCRLLPRPRPGPLAGILMGVALWLLKSKSNGEQLGEFREQTKPI